LKAEVEKVLKDGKMAWDDSFRRSGGVSFPQGAHTGVSIETDPTRCKIRLFGVAKKRSSLEKKKKKKRR
jgi:hypothetical protein